MAINGFKVFGPGSPSTSIEVPDAESAMASLLFNAAVTTVQTQNDFAMSAALRASAIAHPGGLIQTWSVQSVSAGFFVFRNAVAMPAPYP